MNEKLEKRLKAIKMILLDVDGVLTNGQLIIGANGELVKVFNALDGMGIKLAIRAGLLFGIITGRTSKAITVRAKELGIKDIFQGVRDKTESCNIILEKYNLTSEEVAYVGDDWQDLPLLLRVGFSATIDNGAEEVKKRVHYTAKAKGGEGAVREIVELILKAQGLYDKILEEFVNWE